MSWRARVPGAAGAVGRPAVRCAAPGDVVSIMAANAKAMAVRPALERRWDDALAAFGARGEIGVLGVPTRADPVEELSGTCAELRRGSQRCRLASAAAPTATAAAPFLPSHRYRDSPAGADIELRAEGA